MRIFAAALCLVLLGLGLEGVTHARADSAPPWRGDVSAMPQPPAYVSCRWYEGRTLHASDLNHMMADLRAGRCR